MKKEPDDLHVSHLMNEFDENLIYVSFSLNVQKVIIKQRKIWKDRNFYLFIFLSNLESYNYPIA